MVSNPFVLGLLWTVLASPPVPTAVGELPTPERLAARLADDPSQVAPLYGRFAAALSQGGEGTVSLGAYLAEVARVHGRRLSVRGAPWSDEEVDVLLTLQLVDVGRFVRDPAFRFLALPVTTAALGRGVSPALRERLLERLNQLSGLDFDTLEEIAWKWGAVERPSRERLYTGDGKGLRLGSLTGVIEASIYSLASRFFPPPEALDFLASVRQAAPRRRLLVLADGPLGRELSARGKGLRLDLVPTRGYPYSPWPRDPLSFFTPGDGSWIAFLRPNPQPTRELDAWIGRTLVQGLPKDLDRRWRLSWKIADVPFHNGQTVAEDGVLWLSLHTIEFRVLAALGLDRVPVERFAEPIGLRFVEAARGAARELGSFMGLEARFVHPLPAASDPPAVRAAALRRLGGGAGFDLDSLVTLVTDPEGRRIALVADLDAGRALLEAAPAEELDAAAAVYGLGSRGGELRRLLLASQDSPRARGLDLFLEEVARHLSGELDAVERLPLLRVPRELLTAPDDYLDPEFLIGWNNVVVERNGLLARAEGFSSLLESGDAVARQVYGKTGTQLDLFPPLVDSVRRNGGYRCASQHLRS